MRRDFVTGLSISPIIAVSYGALAVVIFAVVTATVVAAHKIIRATTIPIGDLHTGGISVDAAGAEAASVEIVPEFGEMRLRSGAQSLLELDFITNILGDPQVNYDVDRTLGRLVVNRAIGQGLPNARRFGEYQNEWDVRLDGNTPIDLHISMGAGKGELDLRGLTLTGLAIDMGAGEALVDMRGDWPQDFHTQVNGGTGKVTVLLPKDVGARLKVNRAIGAIDLSGLEKREDFYVNAAYGTTDATLDFEINVAVSEVNLVVLDSRADYLKDNEGESRQ